MFRVFFLALSGMTLNIHEQFWLPACVVKISVYKITCARLYLFICIRRNYLILLPGSSLKSRKHSALSSFNSSSKKRKRIAAIQKSQDKDYENIKMHYDVQERTQEPENVIPLTGGMMKSVMESKVHDIKNFLARPIMLGSGVFGTAMTTKTLIQTINLPNDYISHASIKEKMRGFRFFRGTARITMVINGTRFQQGRLLNTFFPQPFFTEQRYNSAIDGLTTLTQLPRVELDVATDDQVTMEIPWVNTYLAFDLNSAIGSQGVFQTWVYSPLVAPTGDPNCEYTIYVSYHDVELSIPSFPSGFVAQAMRERTRRRKKDPITEEMEDDKPVSTSLHYMSKLTGLAAKIPMLSSIAGPTSWFLGKAQDTAYSWGFSKPADVARQSNFMSRPMVTAQNVTGVDMSTNMAAFQENSIMHKNGVFGTDNDEMAISSVVSRFAYFISFPWDDTQVVSTRLFNFVCRPSDMTTYVGNIVMAGTSVGSFLPLPGAYVKDMFMYWRGGFKFKFKFVKTEFHSGRLLFTFCPLPSIIPTTLDQTNYLYREIVDIRNTTEFTFTVPYVSNKPYLSTESIGTINVTVINQLRAPANVSQSIAILCEIAMTEDSEFQVPIPSNSVPVVLVDQAIGPGANNPAWVPQAKDDKPEQTTMDVPIINTQPHEELQPIAVATVNNLDNLDVAPYCIGESIVSLRQLLKRHSNFLRGTKFAFSQSQYFRINPRVLAFGHQKSTYNADEADVANTVIPDWFARIGILFMYNKGSIRVKMYPIAINNSTATPSNNDTIRVRKNNLDLNKAIFSVPTYPTGVGLRALDSIAVFSQSVNPTVELSLPFYSTLPLAVNLTVSYFQTAIANAFATDVSPAVGLDFTASTTSNVNSYIFSRAAGDDFSFGFFLGTVRVVDQYPFTYGSTSTSAPW